MVRKIQKIEDVEKRGWQLLSLMFFLLIFFIVFAMVTIYEYTIVTEIPNGNIYFYSFVILSFLFIAYVLETRLMLKKLRKRIMEDRFVVEQIKEETVRESLLALVAREHYEDCLAMQYKRAQASSTSFSIIVIRINNLINIDNQLGYKTGNEVICQITKIFREIVSGNNTVFRYAADIYTSIVSEIDIEATENLTRQLEHELSQITLPDGGKIDFTVIGTNYPHDTSSLHELRKLALGSYVDENID